MSGTFTSRHNIHRHLNYMRCRIVLNDIWFADPSVDVTGINIKKKCQSTIKNLSVWTACTIVCTAAVNVIILIFTPPGR